MRKAAVVAIAGGLILAACGTSVSPPTPSQLMTNAGRNLEHLTSYRVSGSAYVGADRVVMTADYLSDGDASGNIDIDNVSSRFAVAEGIRYFGTLSPAITGSIDPTAAVLLPHLNAMWWKAAGSATAQNVLSAFAPSSFAFQFLGDRTGLVRSSRRDGEGRAAIALKGPSGTVSVSTKSPTQVFEVATAFHYVTSNNLTNVDVLVDHMNEPLVVTAPAGALPLDDLDALPAFFTARPNDVTGCDVGGCTASATITAAIGHGSSTVHLTLETDPSNVLASCTAPVSIAAVSGTATVSCRATGSGWTNFYYNGGNYKILAQVDNPAYGAAVT